jgi:outer membrane receptor protein involved in Fe transport
VNSYEIGMKSKWLENTLHANVALFRSNYTDLQAGVVTINSVGTVSSFVRNAAASRSQGVELEMQWQPDSHFNLAANLSYLNSYYVSYVNAGPTNSQTFAGIKFQDLSGQPTMFAPRWSGNIHAAYGFTLRDKMRLTFSFDPFFTSSYKLRDTAETINSVFYYGEKSYTRLDGGMTLDGIGHHFAFDIIGKNLNNRIVVSAFGSALTASAIEPRSVVAQIRYKW